MITLGIFLSFKQISSSNLKISNKEFTKLIIDNTYTYNPNIISQAINYVVEKNDPIKLEHRIISQLFYKGKNAVKKWNEIF